MSKIIGLKKDAMAKKGFVLYLAIFVWRAGADQLQVIDLRSYEKCVYSQFGEDGVLQKIFNLIGTTSKYYVEFGAGDGHFCSNVKYLREKDKWTGLLLDGDCYSGNRVHNDVNINLHREFVTAENICDLFKKYNVPREFDLISIDIDRNDFYVWKALCKDYSPRVVVIESCPTFGCNEDKVIEYSSGAVWDGTEWYGSSVLALFNLGRYLGYSLVYEEAAGINLFFIRDDILKSAKLTFKNMNDVKKIYTGKPIINTKCKSKFISSSEALGISR